MQSRRTLGIIFLFVWAAVFATVPAFAGVPGQISYQGRLTDGDGNPLPDDAYTVTFSLYNASDTLLWSETQNDVLVIGGIFNVQIGQDPIGNPFPAFDGEMFLGVKVGSDAEMEPRQALSSVPFAIKAADADHLEGQNASAFAVATHGHGWSDITSIPGGFADGIDDTGILSETDPSVPESVKDGTSWTEISERPAGLDDGDDVGITSWNDIQNMPAGFADGTDDVGGITSETDPQVGTNIEGYMPYWNGSSLSTGAIFGNRTIGGPPNYDNYWKLGIGTTNPTAMLSVTTDAGSSTAVSGENTTYGHSGKLGTSMYGAIGSSADGNYGILGWGFGVYGYNASTKNSGALAGTEGAMGRHDASGNYGQLGRSDYGAYGIHSSSGHWGALGASGAGVEGRSISANDWHTAVYGKNEGSGSGVYGWSQNRFGTVGVTLSTDSNEAGVWAVNNGAGPGIIAEAGTGGYAAYFKGNVAVVNPTTDELIVEIGEGLDYAEGFDVTGKSGIEPGAVLSIDPDHPGRLSLSSAAYDTKVAGIVAGANSLGSGVRLGAGQFDHDVALAGRVYCNVETTEAAVEAGDLLTTSPVPGYAMKAMDHHRAQGAILGKAMQGLVEGQKRQILVLVTLQ